MKSKLIALGLTVPCGAALAITLSASAAEQPPEPLATPPATSQQQYSEYRNDAWHFSLFLPDGWSTVDQEQTGGTTIQFMNAAGEYQFSVSAWPYQDLIVHADGVQVQAPGSESDQRDELDVA